MTVQAAGFWGGPGSLGICEVSNGGSHFGSGQPHLRQARC